jgi:hypothetical protein
MKGLEWYDEPLLWWLVDMGAQVEEQTTWCRLGVVESRLELVWGHVSHRTRANAYEDGHFEAGRQGKGEGGNRTRFEAEACVYG